MKRVSLLVAAALAAQSGAAHAEATSVRPEVVVIPSACASPPWSTAGWLGLLRVELASEGVAVRAANDAGGTERDVEVRLDAVPCDATATEARMNVTLGDARALRTIELRDIEPVARPRALAIAVAGVVREALATPYRQPGQAATRGEVDVRVTVVPAAPAPAPTPTPPAAGRVHGAAIIESRLFGSGVGLFGGRLGLAVEPLAWIVFEGDVGGLATVAHASLGDVDVGAGTLALSSLLTTHGTLGSLSVGPRFEVGPGWFSGHPSEATVRGASATKPLAFLAISAQAVFRMAPRLDGLVAIDAGETAVGVSPRADLGYVADISGPFLSVRVGVMLGQ